MIYDGGLPLGTSAIADSTGTATLAFEQVAPGEAWFVAGLLLSSLPPRATAVWQAFASGIFAGFGSGAFARIGAIPLLEGDTLTVIVTGLQPLDVVTGSVPSGGGFRADDAQDVLLAAAASSSSSAFALASGSAAIGSPPAPSGYTRVRVTGSVAFIPFLPVDANGRTQLWLYHLAILPAQSPSAGGAQILDRTSNTILRFSPANTPTMTSLPMSGILFDTASPGLLLTASWLQVKLAQAADAFDFHAVWTQT